MGFGFRSRLRGHRGKQHPDLACLRAPADRVLFFPSAGGPKLPFPGQILGSDGHIQVNPARFTPIYLCTAEYLRRITIAWTPVHAPMVTSGRGSEAVYSGVLGAGRLTPDGLVIDTLRHRPDSSERSN
jgi:hypothetical protein